MIRVGPAGWSYPDWEGRVYPRSKPRGFHPLGYLAPFVDCVEVNSSFYAVPRREHVERWAELVRGLAGFRFLVKLLQDFTHKPVPDDPREWDRKAADWRAAVEPLVRRRLLAGVLVQFPASFVHGPPGVRRLGRIRTLLEGLPLVLELRHASWFTPLALDEIRGLAYSLAHVDLPPAWSHPPARHPPTGPIGYLRLHGRNEQQWFRKGAGRDDRYDYLYTPPEIGELTERVRSIAAESEETYAITNNHFEGQAVANAIEMRWLLGGREPVRAPPELVRAFPHLAPLVRVEGQRDLF